MSVIKKSINSLLIATFVICCHCYAQPVSEQKAKNIAIRFFYKNVIDNQMASIFHANMSDDSDRVQLWKQKGRNCMYAVNMPDSGWVLVAGDERVEPILATSESGTFPQKEEMPPAMLGLLEDYMNEIQFVQDSCSDTGIHPLWAKIEQGSYSLERQPHSYSPNPGGGYVVGTRLLNRPNRGEVIWNQQGHSGAEPDYAAKRYIYECDYAYNKFCPKWYLAAGQCGTYAGCVAVAMAQLMWYWQWPHTGYIHSGIDKKGNGTGAMELHLYDWNKMPAYLSGIYSGRPTPMNQVDMVAGFLRDCGYAAKMVYGNEKEGSGSTIQKARDALEDTFSYVVGDLIRKFWHSENKWSDLLKAEINAGRPVFYTGTGSGGHAFVVDGYNGSNEFHINWGWGGISNEGWFKLDGLTPPGHDYRSNNKALIGIRPDTSCDPVNINNNNVSSGQTARYGGGGAMTVSNSAISSGGMSVYYSGISVTLRPGFQAKAGSRVHVAIQNFFCDGMVAPASLDPIGLKSVYAEPETGGSTGLNLDYVQGTSIYPNPTDGALYVQTSREVARIELYGLSGEKLLESRETTLDLHGLQEGMYVLMVHFADGTVHSEKVIRNQ